MVSELSLEVGSREGMASKVRRNMFILMTYRHGKGFQYFQLFLFSLNRPKFKNKNFTRENQ